MANEEAEECKQRGNEAFKEQKWDEAIKHYNKAIALDPANAAYYSNRSGAWSSKGNHESALADANKCLRQDPQFVKGYARKGKALFDMDRWDEADVAYKEGLQVDPTNDGCKRGIADITAARQRRSSAGARSSGGRSGGLGGFLPKLIERFKTGGRMQSYMVMLAGYYLFSSFTGRFSKKAPETDVAERPDASDYDYDEAAADGLAPLGRRFGEIDGAWLSYLQAGRRSDSALLLLHRSSLSAETEYGAVIPQLVKAIPGDLQIIAPDRPCHGYSPCPASGEPVNATTWLGALLSTHAAPKRLALAAAGREAAHQAIALARRRPDVAQVWLLDPGAPPADVNASAGTAGLQAWLDQQRPGSLAPRAAADVVHWAAVGGGRRQASGIAAVPKLPKRCKVTILNADEDREEGKLTLALQASGVDPKVRSLGAGEAVLDGLVDEVRQFFGGDSDSAEAEE